MKWNAQTCWNLDGLSGKLQNKGRMVKGQIFLKITVNYTPRGRKRGMDNTPNTSHHLVEFFSLSSLPFVLLSKNPD